MIRHMFRPAMTAARLREQLRMLDAAMAYRARPKVDAGRSCAVLDKVTAITVIHGARV